MSNDDGSGFPAHPGQPGDGSGGFPPAPAPGQQPQQPQYGAQPDYGQAPPPPPGAPQPPGYAPQGYEQQPGYPPQQPQGYGAPPGYVSANGGMVKGPRPDVKIGAILILAGSLITILGVFLPWASGGSEDDITGTSTFFYQDGFTLYQADSPGTIPIVFAVIMAGLAIALFFAGRVLAVAIIAIVGAVIALLIGLAMIGISAGYADDNGGSVGIGAIIQLVAPLLSLAGAIVATAKRRKMVPAGPPPAPGQFGYTG